MEVSEALQTSSTAATSQTTVAALAQPPEPIVSDSDSDGTAWRNNHPYVQFTALEPTDIPLRHIFLWVHSEQEATACIEQFRGLTKLHSSDIETGENCQQWAPLHHHQGGMHCGVTNGQGDTNCACCRAFLFMVNDVHTFGEACLHCMCFYLEHHDFVRDLCITNRQELQSDTDTVELAAALVQLPCGDTEPQACLVCINDFRDSYATDMAACGIDENNRPLNWQVRWPCGHNTCVKHGYHSTSGGKSLQQ